MQKAVIFSLVLLSGITFFLGLNWGKQVQKIDTPNQVTVYVTRIEITKIVTPTSATTPTPTVRPTIETVNDTPEADL